MLNLFIFGGYFWSVYQSLQTMMNDEKAAEFPHQRCFSVVLYTMIRTFPVLIPQYICIYILLHMHAFGVLLPQLFF